MFGLVSPTTVLLLGLYAYVAGAAYTAGRAGGMGRLSAVASAAAWPATIWRLINRLYFTRPRR